MSREPVSIRTKDGVCKATVFTPDANGPWPGVIFYMDALGLRPGLWEMAQHVATRGYVVLLPDLYYRFGPYGPLDPRQVFQGDFRAAVGPMMATTDPLKAADDTAAFLAHLDGRDDVAGSRVGTVGFCMGGGMAIAAAAAYPDRVAAAASFHGGRLATDLPTSPHLGAPRIKAEVYVAAADQDASYPPEMAQRFEAALTAAGVRFKAETYAGKKHGWMKPDFPVYDAEAAARGWKELFSLYATRLWGALPLFHGTKAELKPGDLLAPGRPSNYGQRKVANHVYVSAQMDAATWGAELAVGDGPGRIYQVEATGRLEDDPNLTDQRFPGNLSRSFRTKDPVRVTAEMRDWVGHTPEQLQAMREGLERLKAQGIEHFDD